jgi:hypothetical protein
MKLEGVYTSMKKSASKNLKCINSEHTAKWRDALADANSKLKIAKADCQRFEMAVTVIQGAISRGEPWPSEKSNQDTTNILVR